MKDFKYTRSLKEFQILYNSTKKKYKEVIRKQAKGTGGRSYNLENYYNQEKRDSMNFLRYNYQFSPMLTQIYLYNQ